jgi:hypothetical protein
MILMWPDGPAYPTLPPPPITQDSEEVQRALLLNKELYDVEYRALWRTHHASYFTERHLELLFGEYQGRHLQMQDRGTLAPTYMAHGDPSTVGANFGFAIAHLEHDPDRQAHIVFDIIHAWEPRYFDGEIDYLFIENELVGYARDFGLSSLTFDAWNSAGTIQRLNARIAQLNLPKACSVYKVDPTAKENWEMAEVLKAAIGAGIVHAPAHTLLRDELANLERNGTKVDHPTRGPVQTKDVYDCVARCTYNLLADGAPALFAQLAGLALRGSHPNPNPYHPALNPGPGASTSADRGTDFATAFSNLGASIARRGRLRR